MDKMEKLLFVDDETLVLKSLKRTFHDLPYEIFTAESAEEGFAVLEKNDFAMVASDQRMPGMPGSKFLGIVRKKWPKTVRILLSGHSDLQAVIDSVNQGNIFRYIAKPWEKGDLIKQVEDAVLFHRFIIKFNEMGQVQLGNDGPATERFKGAVEMAGAVCHEFNQPMQIISGYSDMLLDEEALSDEMRGFLVEILTQITKMADITKKLMSLNRYVTREYMGDTKVIDIEKSAELKGN